MIRRVGPLLLLGLVFLLLPWFWPQPAEIASAAFPSPSTETPTSLTQPPSPTAQLPGESILADYAGPSSSPLNDLVLMQRCLATFLLAAKGMETAPLSANDEVAAALRGEARVQVAFLPRDHRVFDPAGRVIDRWGTPLHFHREAADQFTIRSAGPDRELFTGDDLTHPKANRL